MSEKDKVNRQSPFGGPVDVYLGIFDRADGVRGLLEALSKHGVGQDLRVFAGADDKEAFADAPLERIEAESGGGLIREIFAGDEVETEKRYRDAVGRGNYVVQVGVPEDAEAERNRAEELMLAHGGRYIHYFGSLTFEEVLRDKDRS
jgi:hypothetical protein